jgi:hypothetical protein
MKTSKFYVTDPHDPESPHVLDEYAGPHHGVIRPGDQVTYDNPAMPGLGSPAPDGIPLVVAELIDFGGFGGGHLVQAVLNDGAYECGADNLRQVSASVREFPSLEAFYDDRPERRSSGEADYGVHWRDGGRDWPRWRVSYVRVTGEIYAVELRGEYRVRVLGVVPADHVEGGWGPSPRLIYYRTLDGILDGWADPDVSGHDLAWVVRKLTAAGRPA